MNSVISIYDKNTRYWLKWNVELIQSFQVDLSMKFLYL